MRKKLCVSRGVMFAMSMISLTGSTLLSRPVRAADANPGNVAPLQAIIVTARLRSESVLNVPESITVFTKSSLSNLGIHDFEDMATMVPNLSFQNGAVGAGTGNALGFGGTLSVAIRGISGGGTTGFYIDDTPVPPTINPQVVDLDRIEVLKGPQGTLYGEGSMGGNVKLVTNPPELGKESLKYTVSAGETDHAATPDGRATIIANVPIAGDVAAARIVAFVNHNGGFITREFPTANGQLKSVDNQGAEADFGGSVSVLIKPTRALSITPRIMEQATYGHGWPVAYAPYPEFTVTSLTQHRMADVQEGYTDQWYLPSVEVKYRTPNWDFVSSTSYFHRYLFSLEDSTEGNIDALSGAPFNVPASVWSGGVAWPQREEDSNVYEEDRAEWRGTKYVHGIVGLFYSNEVKHWENASSTFDFPGLVTSGAFTSPLLWDQPINTNVLDRAVFGQLYIDLGRFQLTLGLRKYMLNENFSTFSNGFLSGGLLSLPTQKSSQNGMTPLYSLRYTLPGGAIVYATAAKGFRAGGANNPLEASCDPGLQQLGRTASDFSSYRSDDLWNYEVGAKGSVGRFALTGALFEMRWSQIQQTISIPVCFIPVTTNAGSAVIRGGELEAYGRPLPGVLLHVGVGYENTDITQAGLTGLPVGSRILGVPSLTGSASVTYTRALTGRVDGFTTVDYSYTGNSLDGTTTNLYGLPPAVRPGFGLLNARIGVRWGGKQLALYMKNITGSMANLGDNNPAGFQEIDPTTGLPIPRVLVQRPFQFGLEFSAGM